MVAAARSPGLPSAAVVGTALVATMLALAILEHWLMVLPLDTTALWRWALRAGRRREPAAPPRPVVLPLEADENLVRAR